MKVKFKVHNAPSEHLFDVVATHNGKDVPAKIGGLIVELVSEDGSMSQTLRLTDVAAAKKVFEPGGTVIATYKKDAG